MESPTATLVESSSLASLPSIPLQFNNNEKLIAGQQNSAKEKVEKHSSTYSDGLDGSGTEADPYIVKFLENEVEDPLNFKTGKKWAIVMTVAMGTLCISFGSSIYAGGISAMERYFAVDVEVLTLGLSLYVLGFAFGPLVWAPLSELYGRRLVFQVSYLIFTIFQIPLALSKNIETLLIFRFLSGFFGAAPLTNSGGVIADMFDASERALALTGFAMAPFLGPCLGPIAGGFLGQSVSFRWLFWLMFFFSIAMYIPGAIIPETYAPVLLRWRATKYSALTGKVFISEFDLEIDKNETVLDKIKLNLTRPFVLLFGELIIFLFSLYVAIVYGVLYLLFTAYPIVFELNRGYSAGKAGLAFIGVATGFFIGGIINYQENKRYTLLLNAAGGYLEPEARLRMAAVGGCFIAFGLMAFAWTAVPVTIHFLVPIFFTIFFGIGMFLTFLSVTSYIIDAYLFYSASALASNSLLRSCFGFVFPLFAGNLSIPTQSLYSVVLRIMYLFISAFPEIFQIVRHMSAGVGGLAFLGLALGFLVGSIMNFENLTKILA